MRNTAQKTQPHKKQQRKTKTKVGFLLAFCFCCSLSSVALLVFAFGVWVASAWLALSLLRSPALPALSIGPLVPSGPVGALLVPPSGYLVVFATARLSCLWGCVVTAFFPPNAFMASRQVV